MQNNAIKQLVNRFNFLKFQNTDFQNFPLYFPKFPYIMKGPRGRSSNSTTELKFFLVNPDTQCNGKNTAKQNMSSAVCASSMYSRLCMKILSFLFVLALALPRT